MERKIEPHKPINNFPLFSLLLGAVAAVIFFTGDMSNTLQYDRQAIAAGEFWRLITGHWSHWSFYHFLWCTVVFIALGGICELFCRKAFLATIFVSSLLIPVLTWFTAPELELYRGLSGLGSSLFVFGTTWMARQKYLCRDWPGFIMASAAGAAFTAKIIYEFLAGRAVFVNTAELFVPTPLVHLVGGMVGIAMVGMFAYLSGGKSKDIPAKANRILQA